MDWLDIYNRAPRVIGTVAALMAAVIFAGAFIAASWFLYALVTV